MKSPVRYLLDTDVVSETRKKTVDEQVLSFFLSADPSSLYISVLTLGELRKGVALKMRTDSKSASQLSRWVDGLEYGYIDHVLDIDAATAKLWGDLSAQRSRPIVDTLLAATAVVHDLTLVTRNVADVRDMPVTLLNPWKP